MKPLEHVTILDLSRVLACPFASMILAELGATVIKENVDVAGHGAFTIITDPTGAFLGLWQQKKA